MRASWVETERARPAEHVDSGLHVLGVERAGDGQRDQPRLGRRVLGERGELLDGAGRDDLAGAVVVGGGQAVLLELGEHLVAVAAEDRGHAGRRWSAAAAAIALPRSRTSTIACSAVIARAPAAAASSPTLCPATAPTLSNASAGCGNSSRAASRLGGDQQRLGDGGVADRVRVRLGAVVDEVEAGDRGQPAQPFAERGVLDPGGQEAGGLGPLAGSDDGEHTSTLSRRGLGRALGATRRFAGVFL